MTDKPRRGQQGRKIPADELAAILAFAKLNGRAKAAKRFAIADTTLKRHLAACNKGRTPELAQLVTQKLSEAAQRNADLLETAWEAAINRTLKLLPKATMAEALQAVEALGDVRLQRDYFGDGAGNARASGTGKDQATRTPAGRDGGAPSATPDSPVH